MSRFPGTPLTAGLTNSTLGLNTLYYQSFYLPEGCAASRLNLFASFATTMSATNLNLSCGQTISAALYHAGPGTGSDSAISTVWSGSAYWNFVMSSNSNLSVTYPAGFTNGGVLTSSKTLATSNASTFMATSIGGFREIPLPIAGLTLGAGHYWLAVAQSSSADTAGTFQVALSVLQQTAGGQIGWMPLAGASSVSGSGFGIGAPMGTYSATSGAFPVSFPMTSINVLFKPPVTAVMPYFELMNVPLGASNL
jgi:hypothetical protein